MNETYPDCDLTPDDLRVALREMGTYVDITEADLLKIYGLAQQAAKDRISRSVPVGSVMTTEVAAIGEEATLEQAARVLSERGVSGLPVVDEERHVVGVISEGDLLCTTGMERRRGILSFILGEPPKCELNAMVKDFMKRFGNPRRAMRQWNFWSIASECRVCCPGCVPLPGRAVPQRSLAIIDTELARRQP